MRNPLDNRHGKRERLSRTRLGNAHQVFALDEERNGAMLNRRGNGISQTRNPVQKAR